jgi:hypothetical protein
MAIQSDLWFGADDEFIGQCDECGSTWCSAPEPGVALAAGSAQFVAEKPRGTA